jgi:tRNA A37 threonylcarbamoyladenosine synthetase subunit TsaC/SUA5/YrdC
LRREDHPAAVLLSLGLGRPLVSTSLNLGGEPPAAGLEGLSPRLAAALAGALLLPPAPCGRASTVVALEAGGLRLLRAGEVALAAVEAVLGEPGSADPPGGAR